MHRARRPILLFALLLSLSLGAVASGRADGLGEEALALLLPERIKVAGLSIPLPKP